MNFPEVTAEGMAEDVKGGFVWLDYSSVPQAKEAEEARLNAIGTIPAGEMRVETCCYSC